MMLMLLTVYENENYMNHWLGKTALRHFFYSCLFLYYYVSLPSNGNKSHLNRINCNLRERKKRLAFTDIQVQRIEWHIGHMARFLQIK